MCFNSMDYRKSPELGLLHVTFMEKLCKLIRRVTFFLSKLDKGKQRTRQKKELQVGRNKVL
jgi:hypothetical protein